MTAKRARTIHSSVLFGAVTVDGHRTAGQPMLMRTLGIPTAAQAITPGRPSGTSEILKKV